MFSFFLLFPLQEALCTFVSVSFCFPLSSLQFFSCLYSALALVSALEVLFSLPSLGFCTIVTASGNPHLSALVHTGQTPCISETELNTHTHTHAQPPPPNVISCFASQMLPCWTVHHVSTSAQRLEQSLHHVSSRA